MSPGLTSHQQLDAGIAARQHAGRKALKKSKRPFDNYFRTQFRFSPRVRLPVTQTSGVISSYDAVKMMTDPKRAWSTPWDRGGNGVGTRRKRQDVLEPTPTAFGDDSVDRIVQRLIEIRFAWDREDDVLCTSLVPSSLYGTSAHCRPYVSEIASSPLTSSAAHTSGDAAHGGVEPNTADEDGEVVTIAGVAVRIQRRTPSIRRKSGQPKRPHAHSALGFSGVDTVPSIVLDVSHGPFVTSPNVPLMTLRWKGEHREAASAQSSLQLLRRVRSVPVVGLAPRSSFLLLKALATVEVEEPALAVSLAIAIGENYNSFTDVECLEVLRCLRRLAFVRGLPELDTPDINVFTVSALSSSPSRDGDAPALPRLYTEATLTDLMLSRYLGDAAPFLIGKIWARLPEQSRHLLQRGYFLDWFDLLRLAIAASGPQRLPQHLPNSVTEAPYAAKYLFFHHTLGLNEKTLRAMVAALRGASRSTTAVSSPTSEDTVDGNGAHQHTVPDVISRATSSGTPSSLDASTSPLFVDEVREAVDKPLVLWLCASLLVRCVAEALGDVVRYVGDLLYQHAALAAERAAEQDAAQNSNSERNRSSLLDVRGPLVPSHELRHPYPRFSNGAYQQIGCRKPRRVRVRLLPFEAFPRVAQCFSCPYASVTEKAEAQERQRRDRTRQRQQRSARSGSRKGQHDSSATVLSQVSPQCAKREMQSAFAAVLAESPHLVQHIERACAALRWSTDVLHACSEFVRGLPAVPPPPVSVSSGGIAAPRVALTSAARGLREDDEWARETVAMEVRHALCFRYVRSAVQLHIDSLFVFLPWAEMEAQWEPMLTAGDEDGPGAEEATTAGEESGSDGGFTADALGALLADDPVTEGMTRTTSASSGGSVCLSAAEQRARAMMEEMRECLEEFQVAVADVLESHECFFEAPHASSPASPK
jgi:hypothetical protein